MSQKIILVLLGFTERESFSSFFATLRIGTKGSFVGQLNWTVPKVNTCPALPWRAWRMFEYMQCIQSQPKMSHFLPFHIFSLGEFLSIQSRCNNVTPEEHQSLLTPAAWPLLCHNREEECFCVHRTVRARGMQCSFSHCSQKGKSHGSHDQLFISFKKKEGFLELTNL